MASANLWIFTTVAVTFFFAGMWMIHLLRKHFPTLYREIAFKIWVATFCLTTPLFLKGLNTWLYGRRKMYWHYYSNHFAFVNSVYILLSSLLPIVTQMSSLIFGVESLTKNQKKEVKTHTFSEAG
jgi:hypothetical protein